MLVPEVLKRVREIQIRAGRQVADILAGQYVSVFKGRGVEFDEVRPYLPGDEIRSIDWNVTARMGEPYVKRYVEERQLTLLLIADISASLAFGSGSRSKGETVAELCALLALAAIRNDDKVGLLLFAESVRKFIPPRKGQRHALRVIREVLAAGSENDISMSFPPTPRRFPQGAGHQPAESRTGHAPEAPPGTDLAAALEGLRSISCRRAVCFVISDFLDDSRRYLDPLKGARRKHDVIAVRVADRRESRIPSSGLMRMFDPERGTTRLVDTSSPRVRQALAERNARRTETLRAELRGARIDLIQIDTQDSVVDPLVKFFRMRERRVRHR